MVLQRGDVVGERFKVRVIQPMWQTSNADFYLGKMCGIEMLVLLKVGRHFIQREYEILCKLRHPYVVRILEYGFIEEDAFLMMPYYNGLTLEDLVSEHGRLQEALVLQIGKRLGEVLWYFEERDRPILHNDIKPSNIILREDGQIVLLDFGLACEEGEKIGAVLFQGSLGYAAPECWHIEEGNLSKATEVFALGATLYRLLTGQKPAEHYGNFCLEGYGVHPYWEKVIKKCCTLETKYRYQNAAQVLDALSHIKIK